MEADAEADGADKADEEEGAGVALLGLLARNSSICLLTASISASTFVRESTL